MEQLERDRLVLENQKLVLFIYNRLKKDPVTITYKDDIVSEGMVGLVKATKSFDPNKGIKFGTYAGKCIRNEMYKLLKVLYEQVPHEVSLCTPIGHDEYGNEYCLADIIEDESDDSEMAFKNLILDEFEAKQKPKDKQILSAMRKGYNQTQIAKELGITRSAVSLRVIKMRKALQKD